MPASNIRDRKGFETVFRLQFKRLTGVSHSILRDSGRAKDAVQEVFLELWRNREKVVIKGSVEAYLYRAVINRSLDILRKEKRFVLTEKDSEIWVDSGRNTTGETVLANELARIVQKGLEQMPPRCRLIFQLSRYQGLKNREIAEQLDLSLKTVENQMGKALKILKEHLQPHFKDFDQLASLVWLGLLPILMHN